MKLLFFIRKFESGARKMGESSGQSQDLHEILYLLGGNARWNRGDSRNLCGRGDILFDPKGVLVPTTEAPITLGQILFDENLFSPNVHMEKEALYVLGLIKLHAKRGTKIGLSNIGIERTNTVFENMLWEFQNRYRGYSWAIRLKLIELLVTVMRDKRFTIPVKGLKPISEGRIQDVVQYLQTEYMNEIGVEDALSICHLSRSHFHALFKEETGQTFVEYLSSLRCQRAGELLVRTDLPILDIALQCGFNNLSHFYHVFKREKGVTPRHFRVH